MRLYAEPIHVHEFEFHAYFTSQEPVWYDEVPWLDKPLYYIDEILNCVRESAKTCGISFGNDISIIKHALYIYFNEYTKNHNIRSGLYVNRSDIIKLLSFHELVEHANFKPLISKADTLKKLFITSDFITEDRIKEILANKNKWKPNTYDYSFED